MCHVWTQNSPAQWSDTSHGDRQRDVSGDRERVTVGTMMLMRCEELRTGLRYHGLTTTGLKEDLARRLSQVLLRPDTEHLAPTGKQLRYLLWLWRHRDLSGKVLLRLQDIATKEQASSTIHRWKEL